MNRDFVEMLSALSAAGAEFLIVGAHALAAHGHPRATDLAAPGIVFQIGIVPCRIDILTGISGVTFDEAWPARVQATVAGLDLPFIGRAHLATNKRAAGRPKDLADLAALDEE